MIRNKATEEFDPSSLEDWLNQELLGTQHERNQEMCHAVQLGRREAQAFMPYQFILTPEWSRRGRGFTVKPRGTDALMDLRRATDCCL